MTKGPGGYSRYHDNPECVACPRAQSNDTLCLARDGYLALADDDTCADCSTPPTTLLAELDRRAGGVTILAVGKHGLHARTVAVADALSRRVRTLTEPTRRNP